MFPTFSLSLEMLNFKVKCLHLDNVDNQFCCISASSLQERGQQEVCDREKIDNKKQPLGEGKTEGDVTRKLAINTVEPFIEESTGAWLLNEYDVDCIATGAGILGCGGGGNPYLGKLSAVLALKSGKKMRVIHPDR